MQITKLTLLRIIARNIQQYQKNWCYMSQDKMLSLLSKIYNTDIKRRALNYHLADLRKEGYIISIRRTQRQPDGTLCLLSTATCLTQQACKLLVKFGYGYFSGLLKRLRSKYFNPKQPTNEPKTTASRFDPDKVSNAERQKLLDKFYRAFPKYAT
jgi:hypothetical protein